MTNNAKAHLEKALTIRKQATTAALDFKLVMEQKLASIAADANLSLVGKQNAQREARKKALVDISRKALYLKQGFRANLALARKEAEKVINGKVKKPGDEQVERFKRELRKVKTALMLEIDGKKALKTLESFIDRIPGAHEARMVEDEFSELAAQVIESSGGDRSVKPQLARLFERVQNDFVPEEVKEAREILERVEELEEADLFKPLEAAAIRDVIKDVAPVMYDPNKPEKLFEMKEYRGQEGEKHPDLEKLEKEEKRVESAQEGNANSVDAILRKTENSLREGARRDVEFAQRMLEFYREQYKSVEFDDLKKRYAREVERYTAELERAKAKLASLGE